MGHARAISIPAYDPIRIVISKQNRSGRIRRIDRKGQGTVALTEIAVSDRCGVNVVTRDLVRSIDLISQSRGCVRDGEFT